MTCLISAEGFSIFKDVWMWKGGWDSFGYVGCLCKGEMACLHRRSFIVSFLHRECWLWSFDLEFIYKMLSSLRFKLI